MNTTLLSDVSPVGVEDSPEFAMFLLKPKWELDRPLSLVGKADLAFCRHRTNNYPVQ